MYDIADLYKAETTIPIAFEIASQYENNDENLEDLAGVVRRRVRDELVTQHILERMVADIQYLLKKESDDSEDEAVTEDNRTDNGKNVKSYDEDISSSEAIYLWDGVRGTVKNGVQYGKELKE